MITIIMSYKINLRHQNVTKQFIMHDKISLEKLEALIQQSFKLSERILGCCFYLGLKDSQKVYQPLSQLVVLAGHSLHNKTFKLVIQEAFQQELPIISDLALFEEFYIERKSGPVLIVAVKNCASMGEHP